MIGSFVLHLATQRFLTKLLSIDALPIQSVTIYGMFFNDFSGLRDLKVSPDLTNTLFSFS